MKSKFVFFVILSLFAASPSIVDARSKKVVKKTEKRPSSILQGTIDERIKEAKALMVQGKRNQAIEKLNEASVVIRQAHATVPKNQADKFLNDLLARKILFAEQFLLSVSFQAYQEAKRMSELGNFEEGLRDLEAVAAQDQDNVLVLRTRADNLIGLKKYEQAIKALQAILAVFPLDVRSKISLVEIAQAQQRTEEGLALLDDIIPEDSADKERTVILRASLLEQTGRTVEAIEILRKDQEAHLDHVEVLYELGMLYSRIPDREWPARKMLSLFISRCKHMRDNELKARRFDVLVPKAQSALEIIDRKLGV